MGVSIEELVERVYWNPGERVRRPGDRRPFSERLAGFFLVLPANAAIFDPAPPRDPVGSRQEVAAIFGQNVRAARERRHLTQAKLASAAGLSKAGLSLIERGVRETTIETLLSLARALEVTPAFLLGGIAWEPRQSPCARLARAALSATTPTASTARSSGCGARARRPARSRMRSAPRREPSRQSSTACASTATGSRIAARPREPSTKERGGGAASGSRTLLRSAITLPPTASSPPPPTTGRKSQSAKQPPAWAPTWRFTGRPAGLTLRELGEATEVDRTYLHRIENGRAGVPRVSLVVRLAASLNVSCARITAGIAWDPSVGRFKLEAEGDKDFGGRQAPWTEHPPRSAGGEHFAAGSRRTRLDVSRRRGRFRARQPELPNLRGGQASRRAGGRPRRPVRGGGRLVHPAAPGSRIRPGRSSADQSRAGRSARSPLAGRAVRTGDRRCTGLEGCFGRGLCTRTS